MDIFGVIQPAFEQYQAESRQKTSDVCVIISNNLPACFTALQAFIENMVRGERHELLLIRS